MARPNRIVWPSGRGTGVMSELEWEGVDDNKMDDLDWG
jgi:hypothetical protein